MKNLWAKTRKTTEPYAVVSQGGWTWKILKAYKSRSSELKDKYARWFCLVITPYTGPSGDMGDTYCTDIPMTKELQEILVQRLLEEREADAK